MADFNLDDFLVSTDGACLVIGWVDDRVDAIIEFAVLLDDGGQIDLKPHIHRFQRLDVSKVKQVHSDSFDFGLWASVEGLPTPWLGTRIRVRFASNRTAELQLAGTMIGPIDLRDRIVGLLASPRAHAFEANGVDKGLIRVLTALSRAARNQAPAPALWRSGKRVAEPALSIVISLSRDLENARRQMALLATAPDFGRIEIVLVSRFPATSDNFYAFAESMD